MTVGKPIAVWNVVSESVRLIAKNPHIILIQVIPAVPAILSDVFTGASLLSLFGFFAAVASAVLGIMATGAYVPIVRAELNNQAWTIGEGFAKGYQRFWSILGASLLVAVIVILGLFALIIPVIIFATWYAYTVPAIVSEDKGAREGMSASRAFAKDKKWSTFLLFLTFAVVSFLVTILAALVPSTGGRILNTILTVPLDAWISVTIVYTYLTHGPQASATAPGTSPSAQPNAPGAASGTLFCSNCGLALQPDAKFCPNCGKAV